MPQSSCWRWEPSENGGFAAGRDRASILSSQTQYLKTLFLAGFLGSYFKIQSKCSKFYMVSPQCKQTSLPEQLMRSGNNAQKSTVSLHSVCGTAGSAKCPSPKFWSTPVKIKKYLYISTDHVQIILSAAFILFCSERPQVHFQVTPHTFCFTL